eukprot:jgi/Undpi1/4832/HiC_scaffold_19.g08185.m1
MVTERETIARPLAPPEVASLSSEEDSDPEEEEEDEEEEELVAEAVENLLGDIEALQKSSSFPGLEELATIDQKREVYLGPTMESNWVLPGRLLVGAYPASMNDSHHAHLLCTILLQGVTTFVCLQQEYRSEGVTEDMWRSGEALRPYFQDALQLLRKLRDIKAADPRGMPEICAPQDTDFVHFPIVDCNVADDTKVLHLAAKLAARVARGEVLYLHCWGGHGRTGTVVSIMLHLMYGLSADVAMERCQHVHDVRRIPISVGSPQTEAQREQSKLACEPAVGSGGGQKESGNRGVTLSPEGRKSVSASGGGCGGRAATAVGGRRTWIRGRRQAFAQAPNGVGEHVSGWLQAGAEEQQEGDGERGERGDASLGKGKGLVESSSEEGEGGSDCAEHGGGRVSRVRLAVPSPSGGGSEGSDALEGRVPMPRRKSFTEPYSKEDPSRGTRMSRLRRKSAPGKPPADELAEGEASPSTSVPPAEELGEGERGGVLGGEGGRGSPVLGSGASPGSCAAGAGGPCAVAMAGCEGVGEEAEGRMHAGVAAAASACGGGARCARLAKLPVFAKIASGAGVGSGSGDRG